MAASSPVSRDGPRARVVRCEHDAGRWTRAERRPDPGVAGLLARGHVGFVQEAARFERWLEAPQAALTLLIGVEGEPFRARQGTLPDAWVAGLDDVCDVVEPGRQHVCVDLKLSPLGAYTVLGLPLRELSGRVIGLEDLFGAAGRALAERVREAPDWDGRFDPIEVFLARRAAASPAPSPAAAYAWARLSATDGRLAVGQLAAELGCSRRYWAATFNEQVGLPPKTVARLLRFQAVRRRLQSEPGRLAEIAADCGYCDQSHLDRDCRDLAGITPSDFLARQVPGGPVDGD